MKEYKMPRHGCGQINEYKWVSPKSAVWVCWIVCYVHAMFVVHRCISSGCFCQLICTPVRFVCASARLCAYELVYSLKLWLLSMIFQLSCCARKCCAWHHERTATIQTKFEHQFEINWHISLFLTWSGVYSLSAKGISFQPNIDDVLSTQHL